MDVRPEMLAVMVPSPNSWLARALDTMENEPFSWVLMGGFVSCLL